VNQFFPEEGGEDATLLLQPPPTRNDLQVAIRPEMGLVEVGGEESKNASFTTLQAGGDPSSPKISLQLHFDDLIPSALWNNSFPKMWQGLPPPLKGKRTFK
jgi:hypothetical protein